MWLFRRQRWQYAYSRRAWLYFRGRSGTVYSLLGRICQDDAWMPGILGRYFKGPGDMQAAEEEYLKVLFILQDKYFLQKSWMERLRENLGNTA